MSPFVTTFRKTFFRTSRRLSALCAVILLAAAALFALEVKLIPVLPPVITNPSLGQMDLFGEGFGAPMFVVHVNNAGDTTTYRRLYIRYTVSLDYTENGTPRSQRLYQGITDEFSMQPNEVFNVSSTAFLNSKNGNGRIVLKYMEYELDDMQLKDRLVSSKKLPDGTLTFKLILHPVKDPVDDDNTSSHTIMNSIAINLIAPGEEAARTASTQKSPLPHFIWSSQLYPGIYSGDDVFELRLYEAREGVGFSEATSRPPFFSRKVNAYNFQYPADARPLIPGYRYYWEVVGFVRGTFASEIKSEIFGFKLEPLADSTAILAPRKIDDVLELLRPVIGDMTVLELKEFVSAEITIDDQPVSKEQLADVVRKILSGKYTADEPYLK